MWWPLKQTQKPEVIYQHVPLGTIRIRRLESQTISAPATNSTNTSGGDEEEEYEKTQCEAETTEFRHSPCPRRMKKKQGRDLI